MIVSQHASLRWAERFPGLDIENEWCSARRVGKKVKRRIAESCQGHAHLMRGGFRGFYYLLSRNRVVVVCKSPDTVVTVFHYPRSSHEVQK